MSKNLSANKNYSDWHWAHNYLHAFTERPNCKGGGIRHKVKPKTNELHVKQGGKRWTNGDHEKAILMQQSPW